MFERRFTYGEHVHRFSIAANNGGWEVREDEDAVVLRERHRHDWHRVEHDAFLFAVTALRLKQQGWSEC